MYTNIFYHKRRPNKTVRTHNLFITGKKLKKDLKSLGKKG